MARSWFGSSPSRKKPTGPPSRSIHEKYHDSFHDHTAGSAGCTRSSVLTPLPPARPSPTGAAAPAGPPRTSPAVPTWRRHGAVTTMMVAPNTVQYSRSTSSRPVASLHRAHVSVSDGRPGSGAVYACERSRKRLYPTSAIGLPTWATSKSTSAATSEPSTIAFTDRASPMHSAGGAVGRHGQVGEQPVEHGQVPRDDRLLHDREQCLAPSGEHVERSLRPAVRRLHCVHVDAVDGGERVVERLPDGALPRRHPLRGTNRRGRRSARRRERCGPRPTP